LIVQIRLGLSNAFLVRGDRPVLVDTGRPKDAAILAKVLREEGVDVADLALIVHTHAHWDHCGGTWQLKQWSRAPAAVHRADADQMRRGENGPLRPTGLTGALLKRILNPGFPALEPDLLFDDETDLSPFGVHARALSTPGHTPGSITILTSEGEAIVGDMLMGGYLGGRLFRSRPVLHYFADDLAELRASLQKLLALSPSIIYTGHGGPLTADAVRQWLG
jgi:hydroxyacylglutathione hydrolase